MSTIVKVDCNLHCCKLTFGNLAKIGILLPTHRSLKDGYSVSCSLHLNVLKTQLLEWTRLDESQDNQNTLVRELPRIGVRSLDYQTLKLWNECCTQKSDPCINVVA